MRSQTLRLWLIGTLVLAAVISVVGNKANSAWVGWLSAAVFLVALTLYVSWRRAALNERRSRIRTEDQPPDETRTRSDQ
jgi:membrane protein CcdC involved in cytochrome C biogenesis